MRLGLSGSVVYSIGEGDAEGISLVTLALGRTQDSGDALLHVSLLKHKEGKRHHRYSTSSPTPQLKPEPNPYISPSNAIS